MTHTHTHTDPAKNVTLNKSGSAFLVVAQMTHVMCSCEICEIVVCVCVCVFVPILDILSLKCCPKCPDLPAEGARARV